MEPIIQQSTQTAERLVKNSIWLFGAEAISKLTALGIQILAARYLGDEGYGTFGFAFAATGAAIVFIDIGMGMFLTREISRGPERAGAYLGNILVLKGWLSLVSILALAAFFSLAPLGPDTLLVAWAIAAALMVNGYTDMYLAVFRAFERMALVSALMVVQRALFFVFGFICLMLGYQVVAFSAIFLAVSVVCLLITIGQMRLSKLLPEWQVDRKLIKKIFLGSLPICGIILFTYIYFRIDAVMIFFMIGESETGWYSAAFKLIEALALLTASIRAALFPILSRAYGERGNRFARIWKEAARYLLMIGLPLAVGIVLLAPRIIELLYGEMYRAAGPVLMMMAVGLPLIFLNEFAAYLIISADRVKPVMRVAGFGAFLNIALNVLFIPKWGLLGAAGVAVLTELVLFIFYYKHISELCGRIGISNLLFWRPGLSALGMGLMIAALDSWPLLILVALGVGSYLLFLMMLQNFNEFDYMVLRGILSRGPITGPPAMDLPDPELDVSIVIVNYKSMGYLRQCVHSIKGTVTRLDYEIIVVDNDSRDGSVEAIQAEFPEVRLIRNDQNLGLSKAANQGIRISLGRLILFLNSDIVLLPDSLETLVSIMKKSPDMGLLGGRLVNPDGSIQLSFGRMLTFFNELGRKFILNNLLKRYKNSMVRQIVDWLYSSEQEVDWIRGACMLIRREALMDVGLMDENFFLYMEEVDLGVRVKRAGWRVVYTPEATITHYGGGSTAKSRYRATVEYRKSQLYFYKKHYGRLGLKILKLYMKCKLAKNYVVMKLEARLDGKQDDQLEERGRFIQEVMTLVRDYR